MIKTRDRRGLGQSVAFQDPQTTEKLLESLDQLDRHWRSAGCWHKKVFEYRRRIKTGFLDIFQDSPVHRRHADPKIDLLLYHCFKRCGWFKPRKEYNATAAVHACAHLHGLPGRVEQG